MQLYLFLQCFAVYDYEPSKQSANPCPSQELALKTGDVVITYGNERDDGFYYGKVSQRESEWVTARLSGRVGGLFGWLHGWVVDWVWVTEYVSEQATDWVRNSFYNYYCIFIQVHGKKGLVPASFIEEVPVFTYKNRRVSYSFSADCLFLIHNFNA